MVYNRSTTKEKWTIMMYMRDFRLMTTYAYALRASNKLTTENIDDILNDMEMKGIYQPRNGGSTFTGQFKSIQIAWYMFGYYDKSRARGVEKKMVFSPLGNLLLDNLTDRDKVAKIFTTMLFANGFHQPFSQMDSRFNIFPFRLIFKLLRDERLEGRLYNDEVFYLVMFVKQIDKSSYEELVSDILNFRKLSPHEKYKRFKLDERVVGLALHEWRYATGLLESAGIVSVKNEHENRVIGTLCYGKISKITGEPNAKRSYTEDFIVFRQNVIPLVDKLLLNYGFDQKPYAEEELSSHFESDLVVEMYSFYPPELLEAIGIDTKEDHIIADMLSVVNKINYYSHEETEGGEHFEYALTNALNLFLDVEAKRVGGPGNTDVECLYTFDVDKHKKFDVEAKSTSTKLPSINSKRIAKHRIAIKSEYTIIVAPNFSFGVNSDISGEQMVIIKSATLANFLYQYISKAGRKITYKPLDKIIEENQGFDITDKVNEYVYNNFGHGAEDLKLSKKA